MSDSGAKVAVVLSGGGAYGAFEVGVLKALYSGECPVTGGVPLDPSIFTGASVGSFNAAVMASSTPDRLERIWLDRIADPTPGDGANHVYRIRANPFQFFEMSLAHPARALLEGASDLGFLARETVGRLAACATTPGSLPRRALGMFDLCTFLSVAPFRKMLEENLDVPAIRASQKQLRIIATDWHTGKLKIFENRDMTDEADQGLLIVMASAGIPGIFPPVCIGDQTFVDGGVVMNTPLSPALEANATELHVIYLDPDVSRIPLPQTPNTIDTFSRVYATMLATIINEDIATAAWINSGLDVVEKAARGAALTADDQRSFIRVAGKLSERFEAGSFYKKLTIHRYNPGEDMGGLMGMLNFSEDAVRRMIQMGVESALRHNCAENGCVVPNQLAQTASFA